MAKQSSFTWHHWLTVLNLQLGKKLMLMDRKSHSIERKKFNFKFSSNSTVKKNIGSGKKMNSVEKRRFWLGGVMQCKFTNICYLWSKSCEDKGKRRQVWAPHRNFCSKWLPNPAHDFLSVRPSSRILPPLSLSLSDGLALNNVASLCEGIFLSPVHTHVSTDPLSGLPSLGGASLVLQNKV